MKRTYTGEEAESSVRDNDYVYALIRANAKFVRADDMFGIAQQIARRADDIVYMRINNNLYLTNPTSIDPARVIDDLFPAYSCAICVRAMNFDDPFIAYCLQRMGYSPNATPREFGEMECDGGHYYVEHYMVEDAD